MRAVVVSEYGGPEVLRLADLPEPEPGPGEVTITVQFAGVNFTDVRNRIGDALGVVLDPVGGHVRARSFELLAPFGRLVTYSNISREPEVVPGATWTRARCVGYLGFSGGQLPLRAPGLVRPSLLEAAALISSGVIEVRVTSVFPLEQASEAHRMFERRAAVGKFILAV